MSQPQKDDSSGERLIATNPNARSKFFIEDVFEAGMVLTGTEIKSIRQQSPNLKDAYVEVRSMGGERLEAWLLNTHIGPYTHGNIWNHEPLRKRKLLLHKNEIAKLYGATTKKGQTVVALRMYFKKGIAKIEIGLAKGKKKGDKRETVRRKEADREMERAIRKSR